MKAIKIFITLFAFVLITSCNRKYTVEGAVKSLYSQRIEINWDGMVHSNSFISREVFINRPYKIVALFEDESCAHCLVGHLEACKKYLNTLPKDSVTYVCIVPVNEEIILSNIEEGDYSDLCVISDVDGYYSSRNKIDEYRSFYQTYLLDHNNRIILVGDPLRNAKIKELYSNKIAECNR